MNTLIFVVVDQVILLLLFFSDHYSFWREGLVALLGLQRCLVYLYIVIFLNDFYILVEMAVRTEDQRYCRYTNQHLMCRKTRIIKIISKLIWL